MNYTALIKENQKVIYNIAMVLFFHVFYMYMYIWLWYNIKCKLFTLAVCVNLFCVTSQHENIHLSFGFVYVKCYCFGCP